MAFHVRFKANGVLQEKFADAEETLNLLIRSLTLNGCEIDAIEAVDSIQHAGPPVAPL